MACVLAHFAALRKGALHLLWAVWPRTCPGCEVAPVAPDALALCPPCRAALLPNGGRRCFFCDGPRLLPQSCACVLQPKAPGQAAPLVGCRAVLTYAGPLAACIVQGKFLGARQIFVGLGQRMGEDPQVQALLAAADALVPVPLSWARLQTRGYNPCAILAQALARAQTNGNGHAGRLPVLRALRRLDVQAPHSLLGRADRLAAPPRFLACAKVAARLVLVDDVLTTGATLRAAATALTLAGARQVSAVVLARRA